MKNIKISEKTHKDLKKLAKYHGNNIQIIIEYMTDKLVKERAINGN